MTRLKTWNEEKTMTGLIFGIAASAVLWGLLYLTYRCLKYYFSSKGALWLLTQTE